AALTWAPMALAQNKVPSERALEALVKVTLLSFNDANVTGDYTVFHAKLSKPFRQQFSPERLAETFKDFARKDIDFDIIAAYKRSTIPSRGSTTRASCWSKAGSRPSLRASSMI
ncbi:MAG TPA: hypothetical protein VGM96_22380, partial [Reyranella sp.]